MRLFLVLNEEVYAKDPSLKALRIGCNKLYVTIVLECDLKGVERAIRAFIPIYLRPFVKNSKFGKLSDTLMFHIFTIGLQNLVLMIDQALLITLVSLASSYLPSLLLILSDFPLLLFFDYIKSSLRHNGLQNFSHIYGELDRVSETLFHCDRL